VRTALTPRYGPPNQIPFDAGSREPTGIHASHQFSSRMTVLEYTPPQVFVLNVPTCRTLALAVDTHLRLKPSRQWRGVRTL